MMTMDMKLARIAAAAFAVVLELSTASVAQAPADNPLHLSPPRTVTLVVADFDKEVSWYETVLGFQQVKGFGTNNPAGENRVSRIELNGFRLDVVWHKGASRPAPTEPFSYSTLVGWSHISFETTNLDEAYKWLTEHGVKIETARDKNTNALRILRFHDPEGNEIHIELPN